MNRVQKWLYPELNAIDGRRDLEYKVRELIQRGSLTPGREGRQKNLVYGLVVLIIVAYFATWLTFRGLPFLPPLLASLLPGFLALSGGLLMAFMHRRVRRKAIRRAMVRYDIPICIPCGYDLTSSDPCLPCPECGTPYPVLGSAAAGRDSDAEGES